MKVPENSNEIAIIQDDKWLEPFKETIKNRMTWLSDHEDYLKSNFGGLNKFARAHEYYGFNYDKKLKGLWYREWAPNAHRLSLVGDFNNWNTEANILEKKDYGVWEVFLPDSEYSGKIKNYSLVKVNIQSDGGSHNRIPAYIKRVIQDPTDHSFCGQVILDSDYKWTDKNFKFSKKVAPIIYECHVGMATEEGKVGTYNDFKNDVLPRISKLGYNTIQMMAVQEHPYYGSFGYHVSSFFAPTSRFGTPDDLRDLIDEAHKLGIQVIMDVVHSHSVKNFAEGLHEFDGSNDAYFISGEAGWHPDWDSRLFDYGNVEVERFLLSNLTYWLEEFHFDGFRFDGVTSMLYHHHGSTSFGDYNEYFGDSVNNSAIMYLQLANNLVHSINKNALTIAEDMSGMPGACRTVVDGGLGFDYRLAMGVPDYWIKLLKHKQDQDWSVGDIWWELTNRRFKEKTIAYAESHDQALVGDKTLAFWLMDKAMYTDMSIHSESLVVDRGIALHKLIRFVTMTLGGEGYLTFMGNEFGHPEWVDFPREGNDWSYHYARRQWSLASEDHLKYKFLDLFDRDMVSLISENNTLNAKKVDKLHEDEVNNVLIFKKKKLIFVFNFHPENSIEDYTFYVPKKGKYKVIFTSDDEQYGGYNRVDKNYVYSTQKIDDVNKLRLFIPNRTAFVLEKID
ncbi:MAG: alpha amylase C-terminal domain-containing protein [Flavobacteriales bacterium]|nr:alpha amylase C-terminal domain-containing protein [Flavobacteriales bacterium]